MPTITLGNVAPHDKLTIPDTGERVVVPYPHIEQSTTVLQIPADWTFAETLLNVTSQLWPHLSSQPPAWVAVDGDPGLQTSLARAFKCDEGEPDGWEIRVDESKAPTLAAPMAAARVALEQGIGYLEGGPDDPKVKAAEAEQQTISGSDVGELPATPEA